MVMPKELPKPAQFSGLCGHRLVNVIAPTDAFHFHFSTPWGLHMTIRGNIMNAKPLALAALFAAAAIGQASAADLPLKAPPPPPVAPFFFVNDNSISYHYEFDATNPGAGKTPKNVLTFTHFDVWAYGTNFFNVDWLKATNARTPPLGTPAAPCDTFPAGTPTTCAGYTEIYGLFRSTFGWNQLFNTKAFSMGPLTNIEFVVGADLNTDNTTLGSAKRSIQGGLQFDFAAPYKGFLNVGVFAYKEWQNDGFASTFPVALYVQPLGFLPPSVPLTFKSFAVIHGDKGCGEPCGPGSPGLTRTTEYLTQQTLALDVGQMAWNKPGQLSVWGAYRYWKNKFGIAEIQGGVPFVGTVENQFIAGVTMTF